MEGECQKVQDCCKKSFGKFSKYFFDAGNCNIYCKCHPHLVEIKQEVVPKRVNPQFSFIDLSDSSNMDGMPSISSCPSTFSLHMSHSTLVSTYSQYSIRDIPFVLSVIDYFWGMSFATHVSSKLRDLNYDKFCIKNVHCISTTFNDDDLFELPLIISPNGHFG